MQINENILRKMIRDILNEEVMTEEVSKVLKSSERHLIEDPEKVKTQGKIIVKGFKNVQVFEHQLPKPIMSVAIDNQLTKKRTSSAVIKNLGVSLIDKSGENGMIQIAPLGKTIQVVQQKYGGVEQNLKIYVPAGFKDKVITR